MGKKVKPRNEVTHPSHRANPHLEFGYLTLNFFCFTRCSLCFMAGLWNK